MKYFSTKNWSVDFRHDGLLFFTQRIQEMLSHHTNHISKCPILNTHLLVYEYINTYKLVNQHIINETNLKFILEEFKSSFISDPIISINLSKEIQKEILNRLDTSSFSSCDKIMRYLEHLLLDYPSWCRDYIREIVPQEKEKKKINKALSCFIPELIGIGYSQVYIYHLNFKIFHEDPVSSIDALDTFLNHFDFSKKEFCVYIAIDKKAYKFKDILKDRLNISFVSSESKQSFRYDRKRYSLVQIFADALDEQSAAQIACDHLDTFFRYYKFFKDTDSIQYMNKCNVVDKNGVDSFVDLIPKGYNFPERREIDTDGRFSESIITQLLSNAPHSFFTINRILDIHNQALSESSLTNGFLNLWSILEILFVSEQDESKILEIENCMLPILQKNYLSHHFSSLLEDIRDNIPSKTIDDFLNNLPNKNEKNIVQLMQLFILPKYQSARDDLYRILSAYPVLRSRISHTVELFSKKEIIYKDVERFSQRFKWHLRRLYRTRNSIIHSGETPVHLKNLGEHLHDYVDECILQIIIPIVLKQGMQTIKNAIIDNQVLTKLALDLLKIKGSTSSDDINTIYTYIF